MFINYDFFGLSKGANFDDAVPISNLNKIEMYSGLIDEIYIDEDYTLPLVWTGPSTWRYSTVLNAKFDGNLEAGSVTASGFTIDKIRVQKRRDDELVWSNVGELIYNPDDKLYYEQHDFVIQNDMRYQYSLLPVAEEVLGNRVLAEYETADFEGVFLSDLDNNYHLLYDAAVEDITHINTSVKHEPLNSQYPIISYSNLDYAEWGVNATFVSASTRLEHDSSVNIRAESIGRKELFSFLKNKKPKIYRDMHGNLKLVTIIGNPTESFNSDINGLASLNFKLVEIDSTDDTTLREYGLIEGDF